MVSLTHLRSGVRRGQRRIGAHSFGEFPHAVVCSTANVAAGPEATARRGWWRGSGDIALPDLLVVLASASGGKTSVAAQGARTWPVRRRVD